MTLTDAINTQTYNIATKGFAASGGILPSDEIGEQGVRFLRERLGLDVETDEDGDLVCTATSYVSCTVGPVEGHDFGQLTRVGDDISIRWSNGHVERRPSTLRLADLVYHDSIAQAERACRDAR